MRVPSWWPERGLWRHADFLRLWSAQIISAFGSRITRTALPILAVVVLRESDAALGLLAALQLGSAVGVALVAGGFVDRRAKRRILVGCDAVRAALVASLPVAAWLGALTMAHVCVVAAGVGAATSLFRITNGAFLPALVGTVHVGEGNAKLEATEAGAEIAGPAAAGLLIAALGAPLAVLVDAATYVWSAAFLGTIEARDGASRAAVADVGASRGARIRDDLAVGLRAVFGHPILRRLVIAEMALNVTGGFFMALYSVFCLRDLGLSAATFGVVIAFGGVGSLVGAALSRGVAQRFGFGASLVLLALLAEAAMFLIPLAGYVDGVLVIVLLAANQLVSDGAQVAYEVNAVTLRQTVLPLDQLGRANAALVGATTSLMLAASLAAGALGGVVGTRTMLIVGPTIGLVAPLVLFRLRAVARVPAAAPTHAAARDDTAPG